MNFFYANTHMSKPTKDAKNYSGAYIYMYKLRNSKSSNTKYVASYICVFVPLSKSERFSVSYLNN